KARIANLNKQSVYEVFKRACEYGRKDIVYAIIEEYPNINIHFSEDYCFKLACSNGHKEIVKFLINYTYKYAQNWYSRENQSLDIHENNNIEGLTGACRNKHKNIVKLLKENFIFWKHELLNVLRSLCSNV